MTEDKAWYSVRCFIKWQRPSSYEERITLWHANDAEAAIRAAREEAFAYCESDKEHGLSLLGGAQACWLEGQPSVGSEIFSLLRDSDLPSDQYLDTYFMTGDERTHDPSASM